MRRRNFLKTLLTLPVVGGGMMFRNPLSLEWNQAVAGPGQKPILIVIFQRGGNDGLNTVVPFGDPRYRELRPNIAIGEPGTAGGAIDLDGFFGLHPALSPMNTLYQMGELALFPAVHYPDATRSHFEIQKLLEGGATSLQKDGWLNRYLAASPGDALLRAGAFQQAIFSLQGEVTVPVVDASTSNAWKGSANHDEQILRDIYTQSRQEKLFQNMEQASQAGLETLELLQDLDPSAYKPSEGITYPATRFGRNLKRLAQLIKAQMGLEIAAIDIGGWDTHVRQGGHEGNHANRLAEYASGITAFYLDLMLERENILILTMTDFGRTARENGNQGTDHGNAATWMALGGRVRGGIHGIWPGLQEDQLHLGRYLAHTIDFRDILGEILDRHLQAASPATILKGYQYQPVGFL